MNVLSKIDEVIAERGAGAEVLDGVRSFIQKYVALPSEAALDAVTLWAAHTHIAEELDTTPRLGVIAAEAWSGKTRLFEVLELLVRDPIRVGHTTAAPVFRIIDEGHEKGTLPTLLLDEAHQVFRPTTKADPGAGDLRSIVNDGHRRGGTTLRCDGQNNKVRRFRSYAPVAVAGLRDFLPDDTRSRSIVIPMRRRAPDEVVASFRYRTVIAESTPIREALESWSRSVIDRVADCRPEIPEGVTDRPADVWEPLLIVAELVGGEWFERARGACLHFVQGAREEDEQSLGIQLLAHLRRGIGDNGDNGDNAMPIGKGMSPLSPLSPEGGQGACTACVTKYLNADDEAPWGGWHGGQGLNGRSLAGFLKPFRVKSRTVRCAACGSRTRGYHTDQLIDAWSRYLPTRGKVTACKVAAALGQTHEECCEGECPRCGFPESGPTDGSEVVS